MKAIGGYFSFELPVVKRDYIHKDGIHLNSGRNALEYILRSISDIKFLWIPYYTCDVILEPLRKLNISYSFYSINDFLELADDIKLGANEYILVTNYFGIKDSYIRNLSTRYGNRLIIDNAQAFYATPLDGVKTIYSPRKFVGIPDGGIAYMDNGLDINDFEQDISYNRCSHMLKRMDLGAEAGYTEFRENSHLMKNQPVKRISNFTLIMLGSIDFKSIQGQRKENFKRLHEKLSDINQLHIPDMDTFACPMVYPFYSSDSTLKKRLIENKIFVATYWPNVMDWCKPADIEYQLANQIIALPIDQRYGTEEMNYIIKIIEGNE